MAMTHPRTAVAALIAAFFSATSVHADVTLPAIFGDHMVLQIGQPVPVWGTATAGKPITVAIAGQSKQATADADGRWRVTLDPLAGNGPLTMTVTGDGDPVTFTDVLAGEVWLASGQSNMEFALSTAKDAQAVIATADEPQIRFFRVARNPADKLTDELQGRWKVCTPRTAGSASAVGFYFARDLHRKLDRPVGIVQSYWGGTVADAWTPTQAMASHDHLRPILDGYAEALPKFPALRAKYEQNLKQYLARVQRKDPGMTPEAKAWADPSFDDSAWEDFVPGSMNARTRTVDGAFWFRQTVQIPSAWAGRPLAFKPGGVGNIDHTYFNGTLIGTTNSDDLKPGQTRAYEIPAEQVKAGPATIAVRVFNNYRYAAFDSGDEAMTLMPADAKPREAINLSNGWKTAVESTTPQPKSYPAAPNPPLGPDMQRAPANLYNGMIHPLVPFAIRGALWYQGESNAGRAEQYRTLLPAMIKGWRDAWDQPTNRAFPFYVVQLPIFRAPATQPVQKSSWAELREAQVIGTRAAGNSDVVVTIDTGEAKDIHPVDKEPVGQRLALLALHDTYGMKDVVARGPVLIDHSIDGDSVSLRFDHAHGGLAARGDAPLGGFAVAGEDRLWKAATATIAGDRVVVRSPDVATPVAVRYGWADHPTTTNLINAAGLPAGPFRTDAWPETTDGKR